MFLSFNIKTTGVTSGTGNDNPSGALEFTIGFSGVPFYSVFSFLCSVFFISLFVLFVLFLLAVMFSFFLSFTASDLQTFLKDYILVS
jgi:hypothetical protein